MKFRQLTGPFGLAVIGSCVSLLTSSALAQSVAIQSQPVRVTVADSGTNYLIVGVATNSPVRLTNFVNLDTNVTSVVDWSIAGLPAGVGYSVFNYDQTSHDNTNDYGLNLVLNTTNVPQGEHIVNLNATGGAENHFLLTLQSGRMWTGTNNLATAWTSPGSWVGGIAPGPSDDVLFTQLGAQPNTNSFFTNSIITANTEIASLRFSQTSGNTRYHTLNINPGVTLRVTGSKGFMMLRDSTGLGAELDVNINGQGGKLVVSNRSANIANVIDNQQHNRLNMSTLGQFEADVSRIGFGDYTLYPNYTNLVANDFAVGSAPTSWLRPRRFVPNIYLARTNIIRANYVDPFNYTNDINRNYAFSFIRPELEGTTSTSSGGPAVHLGFSNLFLVDSILIGGLGATGPSVAGNNTTMDFNSGLVRTTNIVEGVSTNYTTNTSFFAYFRNTNGVDRVSLMSIGDQSGNGTNFSGSNAKTWANFDNVPGGIVNALVDRLYIAVDKSTNSTDYNTQAGLIIGAGLFDVNTAIVGYQRNSGATNRNYSDGQVIVRSNAVLKINKSIELGYTTEDPNNTVAQPYNNRGRLSIGPGGTAMVNTVLVGGLTKAGNANAVSLTSGAALIVSNKIASPDQWLTTLGVSGESTLTLHLNGTNTGYYVYATNLNVSAGCTLNIASAANVVVPAEGTNVPTFLFVNGGAGNFSVTMPSPMRGTIVPGDSPGESDLLIITNEPRNLVWRRLVNNNWDSTTSNWINTATLQPARFITGDNVLFDDATLPSTTINVAATIVPGAITVSNENNSFVLADGGGSIPGGSLTKEGSGSLAIDASTSIPVEVNGGKLVGLGTVGSVTVASGAELDFSGTISPSGLSCYGTATLRGSTIGTITVQTGGVVTNAETGTSQGSISTRSGSLLYNVGHLGNGGVGIGSSTIVSNATFINAGNIGLSGVNSTLTINGVFKEMGVVGKDVYLTLLDINGGTGTNNNNAGTFIPGGDGIGVTTIKSPGIAGVSFSGRVRLGVGSTNIFKVNPATTNTVLQAAWIDYGPSIGNPGFEGGFIWVTNVGVTPFAAGQRFGLFKYEDGTLPIQFGSTNSYPLMIPTVPGPGLAWDLNDVKMNGNVGIRSYSTTPTNIAFASFYTLVTNLTSTNRGIVMSLQWPSNHIGGWHVEEQTSTRAAGIQMGASNWAPIFASYFTNQIFVTNLINGNGANFYRLTSP